MEKVLVVALVFSVAGSAWAATPKKTVECEAKGKTKWVGTVEACKDLGGKVIEIKKVTQR